MAEKAKPGPSVKDDKTHQALRDEGASKEKAARIANSSAARGRKAVGQKGGKAGSNDDQTVDQLRKRARDLGLSGYSNKTKSDLISMLRDR